MPRLLYLQENPVPVPNVKETGWAPRLVWIGEENLTPNRI
jgi:hypothetical protein